MTLPRDLARSARAAAGTGTDSRLYVTANGGRTWTLAYQNTNPQAFFDCMAFFNPRHGLVMSDPVDGGRRGSRGEKAGQVRIARRGSAPRRRAGSPR